MNLTPMKLTKTSMTVLEFMDDILAEHPDDEGLFTLGSIYGKFPPAFQPHAWYKNGHIVYFGNMFGDGFLKSEVHTVYRIQKNESHVHYVIYI